MAKDDDGDWKSCVRAILSASQTSYCTSSISSLVTLITKRFEVSVVAVFFCRLIRQSVSLFQFSRYQVSVSFSVTVRAVNCINAVANLNKLLVCHNRSHAIVIYLVYKLLTDNYRMSLPGPLTYYYRGLVFTKAFSHLT